MQYFVTGATGFIGKRLVKTLLSRRGVVVHFLVRPGSEGKLAALYEYWGVAPGSKARALPVSGDLTSLRGEWTMQSDGAYTIAHYDIAIEPGHWVPHWIVRAALKHDLPKMLQALRNRAEAMRPGNPG